MIFLELNGRDWTKKLGAILKIFSEIFKKG
jgi:hypothetical protein